MTFLFLGLKVHFLNTRTGDNLKIILKDFTKNFTRILQRFARDENAHKCPMLKRWNRFMNGVF